MILLHEKISINKFTKGCKIDYFFCVYYCDEKRKSNFGLFHQTLIKFDHKKMFKWRPTFFFAFLFTWAWKIDDIMIFCRTDKQKLTHKRKSASAVRLLYQLYISLGIPPKCVYKRKNVFHLVGYVSKYRYI